VGAPKYFVSGFVLYFSLGLVSFALSWYGRFDYISYVFWSIGIAAILAVGLLRNFRAAASLGLSYPFSSVALDYAILQILYSGEFTPYYFSYWFWEVVIEYSLWTVTLLCYGYLPSKLYSRGKRMTMLFLGWMVAFFLEAILSLFINTTRGAGAFFPRLALDLIIGGLTVGLCARRLKVVSPAIPIPTKPTGILPSPTLRCRSCGHENPRRFTYCGKCGVLLREENTKVY
jgi:hypothetical protein